MAFDKRKALKTALAYTQQGQWDKAIAEYEAILKADPNDFSIYNTLGDLYVRIGATAEAIAKYMKLGELYRADGLAVKAIAVYKKVVKLDPQNLSASLACADLYHEQGLTGEAKIQYTVVAEQYAKRGETREALQIYEKIANLDPNNPTILAKLAEMLAKEGMIQEAVAQFHKAAQVASKVGQVEEAQRFFKRMAQLDPRSFEAHYGLGRFLLQVGNDDEAIEELKFAASIDSNNPLPLALLGQAYERKGELPQAEEAYQGGLALDPNAVDPRLHLGRIYLQQRRLDEAFDQYATLADRFSQEGRFDSALELFQGILDVDPGYAKARERVAELLVKSGEVERAKEELRQLADFFSKAGRVEEERAVYERLLTLDPDDSLAVSRLQELGSEGEVGREEAVEPLTVSSAEEAVGEAVEEPFFTEGFPFEEQGVALEEEWELEVEGEPQRSPLQVEIPEREVEIPLEEDTLISEALIEAEVYLKYGLYERAIDHLKATSAMFPGNLVLHEKLKGLYLDRGLVAEGVEEGLAIAKLHLAQGRPSEATSELEQVLSFDPQNAEALELLSSLGAPEAKHETPPASPTLEEAPEEIGEEALPEALKPLLEEEEGEEIGVLKEPEPGQADLSEDLAEAEFYLKQGMYEEAKAAYHRILAKDPENTQAKRMLVELAGQGGGPVEEPGETTFAQEVVPVFKVAKDEEPGEEGFFNLSAELTEELEQVEEAPSRSAGPTLEEILAEFQKGIREHLTEEDYETHYNLGIAYKEMDLYDEAVEEFKLAARDRKRALSSSALIGLCYLAAGRPELAVQELQRGLSLQGFSPEEYRGLKYDLATAYEALGDLQKAFAIFRELEGEDPKFRDIRARLRELKKRLGPQVASPREDTLPSPPIDPSPSKDRITFI